MEIAQLCKSAYNSCSNSYIFVISKKDVSNMAGAHTLAEQKGQTMMHTYTP